MGCVGSSQKKPRQVTGPANTRPNQVDTKQIPKSNTSIKPPQQKPSNIFDSQAATSSQIKNPPPPIKPLPRANVVQKKPEAPSIPFQLPAMSLIVPTSSQSKPPNIKLSRQITVPTPPIPQLNIPRITIDTL